MLKKCQHPKPAAKAGTAAELTFFSILSAVSARFNQRFPVALFVLLITC
jgi:hypothetical protein